MSECFRSKYLSEPIIYVQNEAGWRSYGPGGRTSAGDGSIPQGLLAGLETIDPNEAGEWIDRWSAQADAAESETRGGPLARRLSSTSVAGEMVCEAAVSATPEDVCAAARAWARDLGWRLIRGDGDSLLFRLSTWTWTSPTMEVRATRSSGETKALFVATPMRVYLGARSDTGAICEAFARGVCNELARAGARVFPHGLADWRQDRQKLRKLESIRKHSHWVIVAGIIALFALGFAGLAGAFAIVAAALWLGVLIFVEGVLKRWMVGQAVGPQVALMGVFLVGPTIALTAVAIYFA